MEPTAQEMVAVLIVAIGMIFGFIAFLRAVKKEKEERESESYKLWHNF